MPRRHPGVLGVGLFMFAGPKSQNGKRKPTAENRTSENQNQKLVIYTAHVDVV